MHACMAVKIHGSMKIDPIYSCMNHFLDSGPTMYTYVILACYMTSFQSPSLSLSISISISISAYIHEYACIYQSIDISSIYFNSSS